MPLITADSIYQQLNSLNINYEIIHHQPVFTVADIDFQIPATGVKNLFLRTNQKNNRRYYLVVAREALHIDLKSLASQLAEKRLSFVSPTDLVDKFGLQIGAVGPLALPHKKGSGVKVVIDQGIPVDQPLGFHPNRNDQTLILSYSDFLKFLATRGYQPFFIKEGMTDDHSQADR